MSALGFMTGYTDPMEGVPPRFLDNRPPVLYKYLSPDRTEMFSNCLIRFTQRRALNDILEMMPVGAPRDPAEIAQTEAKMKVIPGVSSAYCCDQDAPERTEAFARQTLDEHALVLCLTKRWDNLPMWAYYADGHNGFVVGFDTNHEFWMPEIFEVQYLESPPRFAGAGDFRAALCSKSVHWEHEQEWRALRVLEGDPPGPDSVDTSKDPPIYLYRFDPRIVSEVTLGHRMSLDRQEGIISLLSKPEFKHAAIYRAEPDPHSFGLIRRRLN